MILAIDPGLNGGLAALDVAGSDGAVDLLIAEDLPTMGMSTQRVIDGGALWRRVQALSKHHPPRVVVIEAAGVMPGQGISSTGRYMRAYGTIIGVMHALEVPLVYVTPAKWKKAMGLSKDKDLSRRRAIEAWPSHAFLFERKKDEHRAEAALLAEYQRREHARR